MIENGQIQQLTPGDGPTALAFYYARLKAVVKEFIRSQPTNENNIHAWALLDKHCQLDLIEVIDQYEHTYTYKQAKNTVQNYDEALRQLQKKINQSVVMLISA